MKRVVMFDILNFFVAFMIFLLPLYFAYLQLPIEIQIFPSVLLVIPIIIALYKRRLDVERIERQETISRVKKISTLLIKLDRIGNISDIASNLTYNREFMGNELASLGWRRYFEKYGNYVDSEFGFYDYRVSGILSGQASKLELGELNSTIRDFYGVVSRFRHLYDDLANMIELAGKIPKDQIKNIEELEENYKDFFEALGNLCDEDEEIRKLFRGKYPLRKPHKKLLNR